MLGNGLGDRPLLLVVDSDAQQLQRVEGVLERAFGSDYGVRGERVAVVLVDEAFPDDGRTELLAAVRTMHPDARRALLVPWGSWADRATALRESCFGHVTLGIGPFGTRWTAPSAGPVPIGL